MLEGPTELQHYPTVETIKQAERRSFERDEGAGTILAIGPGTRRRDTIENQGHAHCVETMRPFLEFRHASCYQEDDVHR
eukprot:9091640-Pyramimonas_sp.AAC.1